MAGEEDTLKHEQPSPGCEDDGPKGSESENDKIWRRGEDLDAELKNLNGLVQGAAVVNDRPCPENGHYRGHQGEPAHESILDGVAMSSAVEATDKWVEGEGDEEDGDDDQHAEDEWADVIPKEGEEQQGDDHGKEGIP